MYRFNMNEIKNGATIKSINSDREFGVKEKIDEHGKYFVIEAHIYTSTTFFWHPGDKTCLKSYYSRRFGHKYTVVSVEEENGIVIFDHELRPELKKEKNKNS